MTTITNIVTYSTIVCFSFVFWWGVTSLLIQIAG